MDAIWTVSARPVGDRKRKVSFRRAKVICYYFLLQKAKKGQNSCNLNKVNIYVKVNKLGYTFKKNNTKTHRTLELIIRTTDYSAWVLFVFVLDVSSTLVLLQRWQVKREKTKTEKRDLLSMRWLGNFAERGQEVGATGIVRDFSKFCG